MKIPDSGRRKTLLIIDVQPGFVTKRNKGVVARIKKLIEKSDYDLYVEALFYAEKGSIWDKQQDYTFPKNNGNFHSELELAEPISKRKAIRLEKVTRSAFKGKPDLLKILKKGKIKEVHVVGLQTNDCVLATTIESSDLGFFTYAIEECCEAGTKRLHEIGLKVLRRQRLTNNSCIEKMSFIKI